MGLDLYFMTKAEYNRAEDAKDLYNELAYGRKTWSIYEFFRRRAIGGNNDWMIEVDYSAVEDFIEFVKPYYDNLVKVSNAYRDYEQEVIDDIPKEITSFANEFFADWETVAGEDYYTLGEDWEINAIIRWYDALSKEPAHYNRKYIMIASY